MNAGSAKLQDFLDAEDLSPGDFGRRAMLSTPTVLSLLRGETKERRPETLARIEQATRGRVPTRSWAEKLRGEKPLSMGAVLLSRWCERIHDPEELACKLHCEVASVYRWLRGERPFVSQSQRIEVITRGYVPETSWDVAADGARMQPTNKTFARQELVERYAWELYKQLHAFEPFEGMAEHAFKQAEEFLAAAHKRTKFSPDSEIEALVRLIDAEPGPKHMHAHAETVQRLLGCSADEALDFVEAVHRKGRYAKLLLALAQHYKNET